MAVKNILKDGTVVDDMSTVAIPKDVVIRIFKIFQRREGEMNGRRTDLQRTGND